MIKNEVDTIKAIRQTDITDIQVLANILTEWSIFFTIPIEEAWDKWMYPFVTEEVTFERIKNYLEKKS